MVVLSNYSPRFTSFCKRFVNQRLFSSPIIAIFYTCALALSSNVYLFISLFPAHIAWPLVYRRALPPCICAAFGTQVLRLPA